MAAFVPFAPGVTQTIVALSSGSTSIAIDPQASVLAIVNAGNNYAFVSFGPGPQAATVATGFPLPPNELVLLSKPLGADTLSVITTGSTNPIYVTTGVGGV